MAYFAQLGTGDVIENVVVVNDDIAISEQSATDFLNTTFKTSNVWKQTYLDGSSRKNYAGIGYSYDRNLDAFIPPQPYPSWRLDEVTCIWEPPVAYPEDYRDIVYGWNEFTTKWEYLYTPDIDESQSWTGSWDDIE